MRLTGKRIPGAAVNFTNISGGISMYHYELDFALVGMPKEIESVIAAIEPLERFSHKTESFPSLADVPAGMEWPRNTIVIVNDEPGFSTSAAREKFGEEARIILCTANAGKLAADALDQIEGFWPLPLTETFTQHETKRLLAKIKAEKDAWFNKQYIDIIIDTLPDMVWFKDMPGCHLKVNLAFCEAVGKTREDVTNKYHAYIWGLSGEEAEYGEAVCRESEMQVAKAGRTLHSEETVFHNKRGLCELSIFKSPVRDENGVIVGTVGIARDVTKENEAREKILTLARTDSLTGLYNRHYFYERMQNHRKGETVTLCYIDLDHFKQINDTYGHKAGDDALIALAGILREKFQDGVITRMGGDEFVVALFGVNDREKLGGRLQELMQETLNAFKDDDQLNALSISIGIAASDAEQIDLEDLLHQSDQAMYWSKEHGRNGYTFYEDIRDKIQTGN